MPGKYLRKNEQYQRRDNTVRYALAFVLSTASCASADIVADVRSAIAQNNLSGAAAYLRSYRATSGVTPEMLAALSKHRWTNYSLFLKSDGMLVGYVETPDFKKAVGGMQTEDVNTRWQLAMKDFFTSLGSGAADTSLEVLDEVFHLD